jgi:RNA polymerase sigma-70 factor (ECF subfamily)
MTARAAGGAQGFAERSISSNATSVSMSDEIVPPRAAEGPASADASSPDSFAVIYEKYADFVWLSLQRFGVRQSDREDLCHDVFVVAYKKLAGYTEKAAIRRWLFAISLRLAANYRRKAYLRFERSVDSVDADSADPRVPEFTWPDAAAIRREAFTRANAILSRMAPLQRVVFVMFELEGIPCDAIASELGIPLGTVYSRLHAARKLFQLEAGRAAEARSGASR